jgi:hypothetical protein
MPINTSRRVDPAQALSVLRSGVGVLSWASPELTSRVFALGSLEGDQRSTVITRLFGIRELTLAQATRHPNPEIRKAALQAGVAIDSIDIVATLMAVRKGAPKAILLTFAAGAGVFVALGLAALNEEC